MDHIDGNVPTSADAEAKSLADWNTADRHARINISQHVVVVDIHQEMRGL